MIVLYWFCVTALCGGNSKLDLDMHSPLLRACFFYKLCYTIGMNWSIDDIANFGKATIKDNTEWRQYLRVKNRIKEHLEAQTDAYKTETLVNIYIHLAILSKYDSNIRFFCKLIEKVTPDLQKQVDNRMQAITNRKREK